MNLVPEPYLAPSICVICESAHSQGDPAWVDTLRDLDIGVPLYLTGRKYVCGACAARIAMAVGFFAPEEHAALEAQLEELADDFKRVEERANDLDQLRDILARAAADLTAEEAE